MLRLSLVTLILASSISGPLGAGELNLAMEGAGGERELLIGLEQSSFRLEYRLSLADTTFRGIELGLLPALPPISRLGMDFKPYLMIAPQRGVTGGLLGEMKELSGLALFSTLADAAFSTKGAMLFFKGEYAVGNIGLRGHLQLDWGELAVQPWAGRTKEPYFPEWTLLTGGSRYFGYLPGSTIYMEIRRRFSEDLTLAEGFTTPFAGSQISPGILLNAELGSFALRLLRQFPQAEQQGYTMLSFGYRQAVLYSPEQMRAAVFQTDFNLRLLPSRAEIDLLSDYSTDQFAVRNQAHLTSEGFSYSLALQVIF